METTNQAKVGPSIQDRVRIFTNYLGASIQCGKHWGVLHSASRETLMYQNANDPNGHRRNDPKNTHCDIKSAVLLLKSLERISDEDQKHIEKLEDVDDSYYPGHIKWGQNWSDCAYVSDNGTFQRYLLIESFQYLQEKGYALPYKNWSVKELVEFGIYKLIE